MLETILLYHSDVMVQLALLVMRVALGGCIIVHGLGKLGYHPTNPGGVKAFAGWLSELGMPFPLLNAWTATLIELVGGILFTVGLGTRFVAFALAMNMVIAAITGHRGGGYLILNNPPGAEYAINLAILFAIVALLGPGDFSLDYLLAQALAGAR